MGWSYRKSVKLGPFHVNLSKSGVGYSVGGRGFRAGVSSRGRRYTSFSIPGTGLRYYSSQKGASTGCAWLLLGMLGGAAGLVATVLVGGFRRGV
jgi:hypothetical protein